MVEAGFEGISKKIEVKSVGSRFTESKLLSCQMYVLLSRIQSVSCDDFLPRTHAHSHTPFSAARTSHARVRFAKIPIAHARARVRLCVCDLSKFAHALLL